MVKIRIFKMEPRNTDEINQFIESVKILENGFLLGNGDSIGILYKERDNIGFDKQDFITAISGELAKVHKNFAIQEGLVRAYKGMIGTYTDQMNEANNQSDKLKKELEEYMETYDRSYDVAVETLSDQIEELKNKLNEAKQKHQSVPKKEKEKYLLQFKEITDQIKITGDELAVSQANRDTYKESFDPKSNQISAEMGTYAVKAANLLGKIKEYSELLEQAMSEREHASMFMSSSEKFLEDLKNDNVEGLKLK